MRRLRAGADVALRSREYLGIRPAPLSGSATEAGWTGTGSGAKSPCAKSPEARTEVLKNAVTERRKALPCASVFRRSGKQAAAVTLPRCAFRRSASLSYFRGRFTEPQL